MIKHLMNRTVHFDRLAEGIGVWVTVVDGKAVVNYMGDEPVTLNEGDNLHVGLKTTDGGRLRHSASWFNAEVASPPEDL